MKKLLISIFLMLSMVVSGLSSLQFTPVASAINKSAVRCDFLGQYINPNSDGKKCEPCPIDFYCPLVSGTEIENCSTKGYPDSDCKETRKIYSTDKAIACPSGTSTKGFTFNTLQGTRITENGDQIFPIIGQGATDKSMCQAPDFKCSGNTPVLLKGVDGVAKCYPLNTCNEDQVAILNNGTPDCSVACKETIVNGKCYQNCPEGEFLEVTSTNNNGIKTQSVICKKITVVVKTCPIIGQTASTPGDLSTCKCTAGQEVSADKLRCEVPVIPCDAPQTGNKPNCVNPPSKPCPANSYGYSEPNCKPCPQNGTSPEGTIDSSGCVIPVVPCTPPQTGNKPNCVNPAAKPCPANSYGPGEPNCKPCPLSGTSPEGTTDSSGCKVPVIPCPENYFGANGNILCTPCPFGSKSPAGTLTQAGCVVQVVPCPENYYGTDGNVLCTPCPNGQTSPQGTQDASGCKGQQGGGGEGFCGGWWGVVCGAVVATTIDCFFTKYLCNRNPNTPDVNTPTVNTPTVRQPNGPAAPSNGYSYIKQTKSSASVCQSYNANYLIELSELSPEYHFDSKSGHNFFWIYTEVSGGKTKKIDTTKRMNGAEVPALKCLFSRYQDARNYLDGVKIGTLKYNESLKNDGILHGRQLNPSSPGVGKVCIDLTVLLEVIAEYDLQVSNKSTVEWAVARTGTNTPLTPWFPTKEEAYNSAREKKLNGSIVDNVNKVSRPTRRVVGPQNVVKKSSNFFNIFGGVKASAAVEEDTDELDTQNVEQQLIDLGLYAPAEVAVEEEEQIYDLGGDTELSSGEEGCPYGTIEREIYGGEIVCIDESNAFMSNEELGLGSDNTTFNPNITCGENESAIYGQCVPSEQRGTVKETTSDDQYCKETYGEEYSFSATSSSCELTEQINANNYLTPEINNYDSTEDRISQERKYCEEVNGGRFVNEECTYPDNSSQENTQSTDQADIQSEYQCSLLGGTYNYGTCIGATQEKVDQAYGADVCRGNNGIYSYRDDTCTYPETPSESSPAEETQTTATLPPQDQSDNDQNSGDDQGDR
jgi:hypothetical protein